MEDCIFCQIIKGEIPSDKIYEDDKVFAFLDLNPADAGHTLVIPKKHSKNILETSKEDLNAIIETSQMLAGKIMKALGAKGFNIFVNTNKEAGQLVFHTHFHIVPRYEENERKYVWTGEPMDFPRHKVLKIVKEALK
ncbi:HIT family protein [Nanoarchaeota archaeon]